MLSWKKKNILWQDLCRLFHVLVQFLFTTSETEPDFITRKWMYELPHELSISKKSAVKHSIEKNLIFLVSSICPKPIVQDCKFKK